MNNESKYYIVIDLEMCKISPENMPKKSNFKNEIIQVGAVKLDMEYNEISRFSSYSKPVYGAICDYIRNLTGITQEMVNEAPEFKQVMEEFVKWVDDDNAKIISWSTSDLSQLRHEVGVKEIGIPALENYFANWIDCQQLFGIAVNARNKWGLEQALYATEIEAEGRMHDGLMDAVNTAKLFRMIKLNPDFKLVAVYESARKEEVDHLSFSMGSLFEGLNFDFKADDEQ